MLFLKVLSPIPMMGGRQMENLQGVTILVMLLGIFSTIFWMVVSWRAMRAHEKLADAVEQLTQRQTANPQTETEPSQES